MVAVARHAMHTRFEALVHGEDAASLRAVAEAALEEVVRLESQISPFRPDSEISNVNREAARRPVRVSPNVFSLLERARSLARESGGTFDPTIGPVLQFWRRMTSPGRAPTSADIESLLKMVGMEKVELRKTDRTVRFAVEGMALDLGAIGKGFAIDCAVDVLRENGVKIAFVHGGTSSAHGFGAPPDAVSWRVAITDPRQTVAPVESQPDLLMEIALHNESLSVSAVRAIVDQPRDNPVAHVLDPRTGRPATKARLAVAVTESAADADAFSTALLVGGHDCLERLATLRTGSSFWLAIQEAGQTGLQLLHRGRTRTGQQSA